MPIAPKGFKVSKFAEDLDHPRRSYVAPGGTDIFVVESDDAKKSANRITLFKDANMDGKPEVSQAFLNDPFFRYIYQCENDDKTKESQGFCPLAIV